MSVKNTIHTFQKMNKDLSEGKNPVQFYYDAHNIRFITNKEVTTGGFSFEKGNEVALTVPTPVISYTTKVIRTGATTLNYVNNEINTLAPNQSGPQIIIGHSVLRNNIVLFSTDNNGFDCIWMVDDENYSIRLLYLRNLDFSTSNPIQVVDNFENEKIDKIYWVDSKNQMRFLNTNHSIANQDLEELIDLTVNTIDMVGSYRLTQPEIINILQGGIHTAGMIQYAYNLYRLNSSQTKISPLTELIPLDKNFLGGGDLNEIVGAIPVVLIDDIDRSYTHIKVYAIKYTSYNQLPSISLIKEQEIPGNGSLEVIDDGNIISSVSIEDFLFLGSDIIIPKHINSKDGRLFFANYKELSFDIDLDFRAYSFNNNSLAEIYDDLYLTIPDTVSGTPLVIDNTMFATVPHKFDSVNLDYDNYRYQSNGTTEGGEGLYIKYELTQDVNKEDHSKFFKDDEIYRIGIKFYNNYGQYSPPKWMADFKAPSGNLKGLYNTLRVELTSTFYAWLNNPANFLTRYDKPIGYKILICERTFNDRTIVANGLMTTMMVNNVSAVNSDNLTYKRNVSINLPKLPTFITRNLGSSGNPLASNILPVFNAAHMFRMDISKSPLTEVFQNAGGSKTASFYQFTSMVQMYSPEILFGQQFGLTNNLKLKVKGALLNTYNASWDKEINFTLAALAITEVKVSGGISPHFNSYTTLNGNGTDTFDTGIISHPGGNDPNAMIKAHFYRVFGNQNVVGLFTQQLITLNQVISPTFSNITLFDSNRAVQILLNPSNNNPSFDLSYSGKVTYTITPDAGYTTVNYSAYIKDAQLGSDLAIISNVNGTQSITFTYTHLVTTIQLSYDYILNYYLYVDPDVNFNFSLDVDIEYSEDQTVSPFAQTLLEQSSSINNNIDLTVSTVPVNPGYIIDPVVPVTENIYGTPEIIERGGDYTSYNNDPNYRYTNSLQSVITDGELAYSEDGLCGRRVVTMNNYGQRNITMVLGDDNSTIEHWNRPTLEQLFINTGISGENYGMIAELVKSNVEIYLGNIYGGNSFEDKKRSNYIEIGEYKEISTNIVDIKSPGDTFVDNFRFERITKLDIDNDNQCAEQIVEILQFTTETTIDLRNRNDLSLQQWDSKFQPSNNDYHKYNRVYSQNPNLILNKDLSFNFKKVQNFDTNVIASKVKTPGELIDNWTDIQLNEVLTMDGKYGAINNLISFKDELFTFQDKAIAFLSINPRVQVAGSDGIAIEIGKGSVLNEYKYVTNNSGSINKWAVATTETGIFYLDALNKSFNVVSREGVQGLSDKEGLHKYFSDNININIIKDDNPILHRGASIGWDKITNDVYLSLFKEDIKTISFNLSQAGFSSFYDYNSSMYIYTKGRMLTIDPSNNNAIYECFSGDYNMFYGLNKKSKMSFILNPEPQVECTFNNLEYKSQALDLNNNEVDYTWEKIRAYNEFQDSNLVNLTNRFNLRKLNRKWRLTIPRSNKVNRIRNTWSIIDLESYNINSYNYRNEDIISYYNPNYKTFN